eukprot:6726043-Alexandrium_andersonii.AAC.1
MCIRDSGCTFVRSVKADHYRVRMLNTPCRGLLGLLPHTSFTTPEGRAQHSRLLARCRRTAAQKRE